MPSGISRILLTYSSCVRVIRYWMQIYKKNDRAQKILTYYLAIGNKL